MKGKQNVLANSSISTVGIFIRAKLLLGAFAKLQKETISFVMSVHLSAWKNSSPTRRILIKLFRKSVEKIQVALKSDKNNGYFT